MIDVVIVGWRPESVNNCITSIELYSQGQARIILIQNRELPDFRVLTITPPTNVGWLLGANMGLRFSTSEYVVLMNDDTEVRTDGWLSKMSQAWSINERLACVAPWGGRGFQSRLPQNSGIHVHAPTLSLDGWGIGTFPVSFFCVMFSREALNTIGLLDERFSPGYGDDDDWLARAHLAGWKMAIQTDVQVSHTGGGYDGQRGELQARNLLLLREKYNKILLDTTTYRGMMPSERNL